MNMKHKYLYFALLLLAASCARVVTENDNLIQKDVLDAWVGQNYPGVTASGTGIYILEDYPGYGAEYGGNSYIQVNYTKSDRSGLVSETTSKETARRVGIYKASTYYGPVIQNTDLSSLPVGIEDLLKGMRVGGRRKALIPGWLQTTDRYSDTSKYITVATDLDDYIYDVTLEDSFDDVIQYQIDKVEDLSRELYASADSIKWGFYYHRTGEPSSEEAIESTATVYMNYTGLLLDGTVFDTNIEKVAKDAGLYSSSKTYSPATVTWGAEADDITVTFAGSSSSTEPIDGFQLTLWQMHPHEKGVGMFISTLGYGSSGSGKTIPAFAPLIFEIELVDKK